MNLVFLSPHFPPTYHLFCVRVREVGANVFGVAEARDHDLQPELRRALTSYYRVENLNDWSQAQGALHYFAERHGPIDRIASHNEHWLELEAFLREQFNVPGRDRDSTELVKRKSLMKETFARAGIGVAPGRLVHTFDDAHAFVREVGFPIIAKPDKGVGAAATYKLTTEQELREFFRVKPHVDYFAEAFIDGTISTFDGLVDADGRIVFYMSLEYSRNIMDVVAEDDHVAYWTLRELPHDLVSTGKRAVHAFDLREQFFHFEFFRTCDGRLLGLEINARPPGWPTIDMFNYANDADAYREWANVIMRRPTQFDWSRKCHSIFIGRKYRFRYRHSHEEIVERYRHAIATIFDIPQIFSGAMGQRAYIARSPDLRELRDMQSFVQDRT